MKIALITGTFFPHAGGVQIEVHNNANQLKKRGNEVDVFVNKSVSLKNNDYKIIKLNYIKLTFLYIFKFYLNLNLNFFFRFFDLRLINLNYNIYHFHFLNFKSLILIEFLKFHQKKIIVTFHGADIQIEKKINYGFRINENYDLYLKKVIGKIDCFQCISKNIFNDLKKIGIKGNKIINISNSIKINKFKKIKRKIRLKKTIKLITVGRYAKYKKGFDLLPIFAKKLIDKKINFKWKIVGENSNKINEDEYIKKNKKFFITIPNIQNELEKYHPNKRLISHYNSSNLYINLARVESFGLTFVEALACGLPILTFKTKGAREIISNHKNGFFIKNLDQLVNKILEIQKNEKMYYKLQKFSQHSVKKYDLKNNILKVEKMYKKNLN
jgi:glycosyltransferase involved in cell wall biosynthesis